MKYTERSKWSKISKTNKKIGFVFSLAFVFMAFQLETPIKVYVPNMSDQPYTELEVTPPISQHKKKLEVPKPPELKKTITIAKEFEIIPVDEPVITKDDVVLLDQNIEDNTQEMQYNSDEDIAPKVDIPEPVEDEDDIILFPGEMPILLSCYEDEVNFDELVRCSNTALLTFIQSRVRYSQLAIENGVEGSVVATFVINKHGDMTSIEIVRGLGYGLDEEVIKVLELVPKWRAGRQQLKNVHVKMTVPIKFNLR